MALAGSSSSAGAPSAPPSDLNSIVQLLQPFGVTAHKSTGGTKTLQQTETSNVRHNIRESTQVRSYPVLNRTRAIGELIYAIKLFLSEHLDASVEILYVMAWKALEYMVSNSIIDPAGFVNHKSSTVLDWIDMKFPDQLAAFATSDQARELVDDLKSMHEQVTSTCVKNQRDYAEDRIFIWHGRLHENVVDLGIMASDPSKQIKPPRPAPAVSIFGVYDGHNGTFAADYACKHLALEIAQSLAKALSEHELMEGGGSVDEQKIQPRILAAFTAIDNEITSLAKQVETAESGSTATVCVLIETPDGQRARAFIAWVGDTQAYIAVQGTGDESGDKDGKKQGPSPTTSSDAVTADAAVAAAGPSTASTSPQPPRLSRGELLFTSLHNTKNPSEVKRIRAIDPNVLPEGALYIANTLAVTRALGDASFRPFTICEPEFWSADMSHRKPWMLIVASDGLWDFVSKEHILAALDHVMENSTQNANMSRELCRLAMESGSQDNITVTVVTFK